MKQYAHVITGMRAEAASRVARRVEPVQVRAKMG